MFDHEKLDVYQKAIEFAARANDIVECFPRGRHYLSDQLQRAALSIVLNIAEGAGKFSDADKASYYTRARGSTTECAAVLDVCVKVRILTVGTVEKDKALLDRICAMLTKLIKSKQAAAKRVSPAPVHAPAPAPGFSEGDTPAGDPRGFSDRDTPQ